MLLNYLKVAVRNLARHRAYSIINISGLTVGIACCLLIFIYVVDELSYDKFHEKAGRIYRLQYNIENFNLVMTPPPMADAMRDYFSEIESIGRMFTRNATVEVESETSSPRRFEEERLFFIDSTLFDVFTFNVIEGQTVNLLTEPFTVVINQGVASKYFGNESAIGKTIKLEGRANFKVVAVAEDFPSNSHWHFNILLPYHNMFDVEAEAVSIALRQSVQSNWLISHSNTYMVLKSGQSSESVDARFPEFLHAYLPKEFERNQTFNLQPLLDIRLNADIDNQIEPIGNITYLYLFISIAIATLLIACINFINLSTARSLQRVKEVGMRKGNGCLEKPTHLPISWRITSVQPYCFCIGHCFRYLCLACFK